MSILTAATSSAQPPRMPGTEIAPLELAFLAHDHANPLRLIALRSLTA
jgi:hypothetical protein